MLRITTHAVMLVGSLGAQADERPTFRELHEEGKPEDWPRVGNPVRAVRVTVGRHAKSRVDLSYTDKFGRRFIQFMDRVLVISWFQGDGGTVLQYMVKESGKVYSVRMIESWAFQASQFGELDETEFERLRTVLKTLPKSKAEPPINRTVYVSFLDGDEWRTETYDEKKLPDEFESVMKIIGERSETKKRHERSTKDAE